MRLRRLFATLATIATTLCLALSVPAVANGQSLPQAILAGNPQGYWRLGETGSTATNLGSLGPAADGSFDNFGAGEQNVPSLAPSTSDGAAFFDGNDNQVTMPNSALDDTQTARTVSAWFNANDVTGNNQRHVIWHQGGGARGLNIYLEQGELVTNVWSNPESDGDADNWGSQNNTNFNVQGGAHEARFLATGDTTANDVGNAIATNTTYHAGVIYNHSNTDNLDGALQLYLNGVLVGSRADLGKLYGHANAL